MPTTNPESLNLFVNQYLELAADQRRRLDLDSFKKAFFYKCSDSFHLDELTFWCDLFGIDSQEVLDNFTESGGWARLTGNVFVRRPLDSMEEVRELCHAYHISREHLEKHLCNVFAETHGFIFHAMQKLPYSYEVLIILLHKVPGLIMMNDLYWLPAKQVPLPVQVLSRCANAPLNRLDVLIVSTFVKVGKPLRVEELVYQCIGVLCAPPAVKNAFAFMLEFLPVFRIEETDYWALDEWTAWLDIRIINALYEWFEEQPPQPLSAITDTFPQWNKKLHLKILHAWPEFTVYEDGTYSIRIVEFDEQLLSMLRPEILRLLKDVENGIRINELYQQIQAMLVPQGIVLQLRDFKLFIKTWGETAIIRGTVFLMTKVPFNRMRHSDVAYLIIKENGSPMLYSDLEQEFRIRTGYKYAFSSVLIVEPKLSRSSRGTWALKEWGLPEYDADIHKRMADILLSIITEAGRPIHKNEIRRQLRRKGMQMNDGTLHLDLMENPNITQVARGVYALTSWNLSFRDLFKYNFQFRLSLPDGNPSITELEHGTLIEYTVTKACLELNRILIKRYMVPYFEGITDYLRYDIADIDGDPYMGWASSMDDGRYQVLGLRRWFKTYQPRYGESIYLLMMESRKRKFVLLTSEQAEVHLGY